MISRRAYLRGTALLPAVVHGQSSPSRVRIGTTDWDLQQAGKPATDHTGMKPRVRHYRGQPSECAARWPIQGHAALANLQDPGVIYDSNLLD
jgi:hypothetical protein